MMTRNAARIFLVLFLAGIFSVPVFAGNQTADQTGGENNFSQPGYGITSENRNGMVYDLVMILEIIGLDISYGNSGETIFSMVDQSLNTIISDLSSGYAGGFPEVPLIRETFSHLGLKPEDIVINPDNVSGSFKPVEVFNRQYPKTPQ